MVIAWDVDDVLNDLTMSWLDWVGLTLPEEVNATGRVSDWIAAQGIDTEMYLSSLDQFRVSRYQTLAPNEIVLTLLHGWTGLGFMHIALSATPQFAQETVSAWTMRNFGEWFQGILFSPSPRTSDLIKQPHRTKGDVMQRFRHPAVLIDDSEENLASLEIDCAGILYPRPWNTARDLDLSCLKSAIPFMTDNG